MRLFVSVDIEPTPALAALQEPFEELDGVRLVPPEQVHVTLKFLDDQPADRLSALTAAIDRAVDETAVAPFTMTLDGYGVFPDRSYITVIWAAITAGTGQLRTLHDAIERETTAVTGVTRSERTFTPHATIARMEHAAEKTAVQDRLDHTPATHTEHVTEIELRESELTADGPVYTSRYRRSLPA